MQHRSPSHLHKWGLLVQKFLLHFLHFRQPLLVYQHHSCCQSVTTASALPESPEEDQPHWEVAGGLWSLHNREYLNILSQCGMRAVQQLTRKHYRGSLMQHTHTQKNHHLPTPPFSKSLQTPTTYPEPKNNCKRQFSPWLPSIWPPALRQTLQGNENSNLKT